MRAMILAAGRGERLRPLTDDRPKPLVPIAGKPLIEYVIERLVAADIVEIVVNVSYRGAQLMDFLANGHRFGVSIQYSEEGEPPLETGGGIRRALPLLGEQPFLVVNADVWSDLSLSGLALPAGELAHLVLVDNPAHHPNGDYRLKGGRVSRAAAPRLTYSGIGVYAPAFFDGDWPERVGLAPLIDHACERHRVSGQHFTGFWTDVGTIDRLAAVEAHLATGSIVSASHTRPSR
ncbi:MAG: N-acetylmuramate alpha-1-phosphate uridylyltransferase MurU [Pseudomonadota bacterium]